MEVSSSSLPLSLLGSMYLSRYLCVSILLHTITVILLHTITVICDPLPCWDLCISLVSLMPLFRVSVYMFTTLYPHHFVRKNFAKTRIHTIHTNIHTIYHTFMCTLYIHLVCVSTMLFVNTWQNHIYTHCIHKYTHYTVYTYVQIMHIMCGLYLEP